MKPLLVWERGGYRQCVCTWAFAFQKADPSENAFDHSNFTSLFSERLKDHPRSIRTANNAWFGSPDSLGNSAQSRRRRLRRLDPTYLQVWWHPKNRSSSNPHKGIDGSAGSGSIVASNWKSEHHLCFSLWAALFEYHRILDFHLVEHDESRPAFWPKGSELSRAYRSNFTVPAFFCTISFPMNHPSTSLRI